ncbi:MAG: class I SAM-dependent methyltransferase [Treponema sp.]|jgi:23S rRNA G2069 N7-methylase RlmK/C1962 C5-methylase RlmI|nr:class I SAM-dependent methyltransferase [Treponema sp.]
MAKDIQAAPADEAGKTAYQSRMLAGRLQKRFRHLDKWARRTGAGAFRLYDRDIPEIPLVLDWYGGALAGALYRRPYEKDQAAEKRWLEAMKAAAAGALGIDPRGIFLKYRERQRGLAQYEKIGGQHFVKEISEGGLVFKVNLSDYLDTGLFLDRRLMRAMVRAEAAGRRVLNLFCYTGSFSVYAAAGGAVSTDSVDLSNTYLEWAGENFAFNGFQAEMTGAEAVLRSGSPLPLRGAGKAVSHRLIRADASVFLRRAAAAALRWDLIILDPPAFSNSKKMTGSLDLKRDHAGLIARCLTLLSPGGKLRFSANARQLKVRPAELEAALAADFPGVSVSDFGAKTVDEDFRGRKTPLSLLVRAD